ncbi:Na+/H+ antiporter NhaA [Nakamurella lactea]|uniref:Na+/H+ antiporter NhaA n=1 Tax=Nakamurella lactea TaxID=459515 RepID=UPI0006886D2A
MDTPGPTQPEPVRPARRRTGRTLFGRGSWPEASRIAGLLRQETVGGALLLVATAVALIWANSPAADSYLNLRDTVVGPASLHLDLTLGQWASDGLLAIFFFVAGLELKREFVAGDLRDPRRAMVPVAAAVGGMIVPALLYLLVNTTSDAGISRGWAVPTATDIAFALAVLAVISTHLPTALRTFLLTLAVVDDLLAITVIALFFTDELHPGYLALALIPLALFGFCVQRRVRSWYLLVPLGVITWALVHASGIHATVAGVLLGFTVPVLRSRANGGPEAGPGLAEIFEHRIRPLSAGVAVPVFAFFAAGVAIGGLPGIRSALADPVMLGITAGLVLGKPIGIALATLVVGKLARQPLAEDLSWWDVIGLAMLGGVGFTVSLLISELAFGPGTAADDHAKVGILLGSVLAALLSAVLLRIRNRVYRRICEQESLDADADGVPDVYAPPASTAEPD